MKPQFKDFLNALLPVAEELGEKPATVEVTTCPKHIDNVTVELVTSFAEGKVTRTVKIATPE